MACLRGTRNRTRTTHGRRDGQGDLEPAAGPEIPLDALQAGRFELETDGEEKHDDADLGHDVDRAPCS